MMTLIIPRKEAPVSGEGTVVIPQPAGDEPVIKNTFFFPDIDPKRVRERMRLEQTVAPARLREAIKSGMAETNAELYEYREQKIAAGFTRLADVPADDIDGESIKVFYYERAVCAMATASLPDLSLPAVCGIGSMLGIAGYQVIEIAIQRRFKGRGKP